MRVFTGGGFFGQADQLTGIVLQTPAGLGFLGFRDELSTGYSTGFGGKVTLSEAGFFLAGAFLQPEGFKHDSQKPDPGAMILPGIPSQKTCRKVAMKPVADPAAPFSLPASFP